MRKKMLLKSLKTWTCSKQEWLVRRTYCLINGTELEQWCMDHTSIITGNVFSVLRITFNEDRFSDHLYNTYYVTLVKVVVQQLSICPGMKAVSCQTIKIDLMDCA